MNDMELWQGRDDSLRDVGFEEYRALMRGEFPGEPKPKRQILPETRLRSIAQDIGAEYKQETAEGALDRLPTLTDLLVAECLV